MSRNVKELTQKRCWGPQHASLLQGSLTAPVLAVAHGLSSGQAVEQGPLLMSRSQAVAHR